MLDTLTADDFATRLNEPMTLDAGGEQLPFVPVEVRRFPEHRLRVAQPFAVIFEGPAAPVLRQGIFPLQHPVHGALELFIVPIAADGRAARYEVIFN